MAKVLIVGGAGYIGSSTAAWLLDRGHEVVILDDLSTGHREHALGEVTVARAGDEAAVRALLARHRIDCVMHFAAMALVSESHLHPERYFENNVEQTRKLLGSLLAGGVERFIFSSTCAIFGDHGTRKISEDLPKSPLSPYGESKLQAEALLAELAGTRGLKAVALRYFNAAGAEPSLRVGERHDPETHLIPNVLKAALSGRSVTVLGTDYPTADGTCIRDYVHVCDLAAAHEAAMVRLLTKGSPGSFEAFNLGSEHGYSVREIIAACERAVGHPIAVTSAARRPGDAPCLVADSTRARAELGFAIRYPLDRIVETALGWERTLARRAKAA